MAQQPYPRITMHLIHRKKVRIGEQIDAYCDPISTPPALLSTTHFSLVLIPVSNRDFVALIIPRRHHLAPLD